MKSPDPDPSQVPAATTETPELDPGSPSTDTSPASLTATAPSEPGSTADSVAQSNPPDVSKSERKREADRITLLGKTISELGEPDIRRLPLDDGVLEAVLMLRRINTRGARKRQLLYLGKLLRKSDLTAIEFGLLQMQQAAKTATQQFHAVEIWRDRLLHEGTDALSEFLRQYPESDRQHLRQLLRNAQRETEQSSPPKAARELFKLLRDIMR